MALDPHPSSRCATFCGLLIFVTLMHACDRADRSATPAPSATPQAAEPGTKLTLIVPGAESWAPDQAFIRLADPHDGLSAAVRLVGLSGLEPLCVPAEMSDATASHLRVVPLSNECWALGVADLRDDQVLRAPVLLNPDGEVRLVAEGLEEELLCLHVAKDAEVFPHLLISPRHVWVFLGSVEPALTLAGPDVAGFCLREEGGFPYVALVTGAIGHEFVEVARYLWEPYEFAFTGPAKDALPDPPGGKFELDLPNSPRLIPMGGEIPDPKPLPEPPRMRGDDLAAAPGSFKGGDTGWCRTGMRSTVPAGADAPARRG